MLMVMVVVTPVIVSGEFAPTVQEFALNVAAGTATVVSAALEPHKPFPAVQGRANAPVPSLTVKLPDESGAQLAVVLDPEVGGWPLL